MSIHHVTVERSCLSSFQRPRTRRADGRAPRRPVVDHYKLHFVNGHLTDPYLAVRLRAPVPSLTPGSWVVAASNAVLHASLSSAFFSLRQVVISSALGINALQSLNTSGVHAIRCSRVPCEKEGVGEIVANSKASRMHRAAEQVSRNTVHLFWPFTRIRGPAIRNRSRYSTSSWQT